MGAATHLGIELREYDARIRTFIPRYEEMLDRAAAALAAVRPRPAVIVDLGVGSGALAARCVRVAPRARVIGIDSDEAMLAVATRRLGPRFTPVAANFETAPLPQCDAIVASFALHHIRTPRRKAALYRRAFAVLRRRGVLVTADCHPAANRAMRRRDRAAWQAHLEQRYTRARAAAFLRAWAKEDVYFSLDDELALLRQAGFDVEVPWRRDSFAVLVGVKQSTRRVRIAK